MKTEPYETLRENFFQTDLYVILKRWKKIVTLDANYNCKLSCFILKCGLSWVELQPEADRSRFDYEKKFK